MRARRARPVEQLLDQPLGAHHLVGVHEQNAQQRPLPGPAQRQGLPIKGHGQRTKDAEPHRGGCLRAHPGDYLTSAPGAQWPADSGCQRRVRPR